MLHILAIFFTTRVFFLNFNIYTSKQAIARHAASCGITPSWVESHLCLWARNLLDSHSHRSGNQPASMDEAAAAGPPADTTGQPSTGPGSQTMPNVGGNGDAMAVELLGRGSA